MTLPRLGHRTTGGRVARSRSLLKLGLTKRRSICVWRFQFSFGGEVSSHFCVERLSRIEILLARYILSITFAKQVQLVWLHDVVTGHLFDNMCATEPR